MTIFARPLTRHLRPRLGASAATLLVCLAGASTAALVTAAPAGAVVTEVEGVQAGLQPRNPTTLGTPGEEPETFNNENGNVVLHGSSDYAIYWDPSKQLHHEWLVNLDGFFHALGEPGESILGTPFAVLGQYRDRSNAVTAFQAVFKGAYSDTVKFPTAGCVDPHPLVEGAATCLTDAQLREQLKSFIATHNLPTGMGTVYFLMTPPGVTVCLDAAASHCSDFSLSAGEESKEERKSVSYKDSFCSYHGDINPDNAVEGDGNTILYAAVPWTAGDLGLAGYRGSAHVYENAFDCQDGGWNPEKHEEKREKERELSAEEKTALEKETAEKRAEAEKERRLEGPHIEEPNQEEQGEFGDYSPGLTDVLVNQIAEEEANIVTDPLLSSWKDASGNEVTDMCRNVYANTAGPSGGTIAGAAVANLNTEAGFLSNVSVGSGRYYINNVFGFEGCEGGVGLVPRFTAPNPVNAGEIIGVDGMESTVSLIRGQAFGASGPPTTTYATFGWNFGDGTPEVKGYAPGAPTCEAPWLSPCAASAFHSYQYGGEYKVTLTITDVADHTTSITHTVNVVGPPPPGQGAGSGAASGSASSAGSGSGAGAGTAGATGTPSTPPLPAPVAAAAVVSRTLRSVTKHGVTVRYSVNEQVAGHFEVLLARSLARHLGIVGTPALGLPAGSPQELVIAKAIVVTTAGGRSTVNILFSKRTSQRLARLHSVTMMLRLVVRNASHSPTSTTVLSSFTLTH